MSWLLFFGSKYAEEFLESVRSCIALNTKNSDSLSGSTLRVEEVKARMTLCCDMFREIKKCLIGAFVECFQMLWRSRLKRESSNLMRELEDFRQGKEKSKSLRHQKISPHRAKVVEERKGIFLNCILFPSILVQTFRKFWLHFNRFPYFTVFSNNTNLI